MIQASPTAKQIMKPIINPPVLTPDSEPPLRISSSKLPIITGMLMRKEYLALILLQPISLEVAIVVPLRLIPGITASP